MENNTPRHKAAGLTHHKYRKYLSHEPAKTEAFPSDWFVARWPTVGIFVGQEEFGMLEFGASISNDTILVILV